MEFKSEQGLFRHKELVGVLEKLPVDCLLSRSSFGQTLSKKNVLDQWERNILGCDRGADVAFILTQWQKALEDAQKRSDKMVDQENLVALKNLSKKETKKNSLIEGELSMLFEDREPIKTVGENTV